MIGGGIYSLYIRICFLTGQMEEFDDHGKKLYENGNVPVSLLFLSRIGVLLFTSLIILAEVVTN